MSAIAKNALKRHIFNIATVERAAQQMANAVGERPLLGRLKYLRNMNFPLPASKGRGSKANLGIDDFLQILFALELINAGMSPTRAIRVMRTDWKTVKRAIAYGWSRASDLGDSTLPHRYLVLAPCVLSELGNDDRAEEPLHEIVGILSRDELSEQEDAGTAPRRILLINTQAFAKSLMGLDESMIGASKSELFNEIQKFSKEADQA